MNSRTIDVHLFRLHVFRFRAILPVFLLAAVLGASRKTCFSSNPKNVSFVEPNKNYTKRTTPVDPRRRGGWVDIRKVSKSFSSLRSIFSCTGKHKHKKHRDPQHHKNETKRNETNTRNFAGVISSITNQKRKLTEPGRFQNENWNVAWKCLHECAKKDKFSRGRADRYFVAPQLHAVGHAFENILTWRQSSAANRAKNITNKR